MLLCKKSTAFLISFGKERIFSHLYPQWSPRLPFVSYLFFFDILRICQNLFHACPLEAGLTLMMGGRTVEGGSRARPTGGGSARVPRARASTPGHGAMASRSWGCTPGPAGTVTRAPGHRASATASAWKAKAGGTTGASGHRDSKAVMGSWRAQAAGRSTRGPGATVYRTDMALRHTPMEVSINPALLPCLFNGQNTQRWLSCILSVCNAVRPLKKALEFSLLAARETQLVTMFSIDLKTPLTSFQSVDSVCGASISVVQRWGHYNGITATIAYLGVTHTG